MDSLNLSNGLLNDSSDKLNISTGILTALLQQNPSNSSAYPIKSEKVETETIKRVECDKTLISELSDTKLLNPKKRLLQRHLMEKIVSTKSVNDCKNDNSDKDDDSDKEENSISDDAPHGRGKNGKPLARAPFIPSYMDPKCGPFFCKVCGADASGLHYKVMACEGCKGFFRRSVQKNLKYSCKMDEKCLITKHTRSKCQKCRWKLCIQAGMDVSSVLSEDERKAKNKLIQANRQKRHIHDSSVTTTTSHNHSLLNKTYATSVESATTSDTSINEMASICPIQREISVSIINVIEQLNKAYRHVFASPDSYVKSIKQERHHQSSSSSSLSNSNIISHPIIGCISQFASLIPTVCDKLNDSDFREFLHANRFKSILLCCVLSYTQDTTNQLPYITLPSGARFNELSLVQHPHLEPLWKYALKMHKINPSTSEKALISAITLFVGNIPACLRQLYEQLLSAMEYLQHGKPLRLSEVLVIVFSELQNLANYLSDMQAPLGQHLLINSTNSVYVSHSPSTTSNTNTSCATTLNTSDHFLQPPNFGNIIDHHHNINSLNICPLQLPIISGSSSYTVKPPSTSTPPSIFSFTYDDKHL